MPTSLPAYYSGTVRCTARPQALSADTQTSPPVVRQAALQGGLPDDFHREERSAQKRHLAAAHRKRHFTAATSTAPPHSRISALPDRRSHARLNNADCEWIQHAPEFLAAQGTPAQLDALDDVTSACYDTQLFDDRERAALRLTLDMTRQVAVQLKIIEQARALFGERQTVELMGSIAGYNMVSRFLVVLGIDTAGE